MEKSYTSAERPDADNESVAKVNATLAQIEQSYDHDDRVAKNHIASQMFDPLLKVSTRNLRELQQRLNIEPSPTAYAELKKALADRPGFLEAYLNEPAPALTMGAGAVHAMTKDRIEEMAKARGISQDGSDLKRGIA